MPTPATNDPMRVWGFQGRHGGTAPTENETALPQPPPKGGRKKSPPGGKKKSPPGGEDRCEE
ncbi:MAG: hypothetical protein EAZ96_05995 [Oscillatoriales cyanobacterium]|nr:MAG: hypothetical protein EAZ96_05995 [Oscillatoriales cyanobacterium]